MWCFFLWLRCLLSYCCWLELRFTTLSQRVQWFLPTISPHLQQFHHQKTTLFRNVSLVKPLWFLHHWIKIWVICCFSTLLDIFWLFFCCNQLQVTMFLWFLSWFSQHLSIGSAPEVGPKWPWFKEKNDRTFTGSYLLIFKFLLLDTVTFTINQICVVMKKLPPGSSKWPFWVF